MSNLYTVHTIIYRGTHSSQTCYRGRVEGESGYWKVSKDFDSHTEAEMWCKSRLKDQCIQEYTRVGGSIIDVDK